MAGPSHFSPELIAEEFVEAEILIASPLRGCTDLNDTDDIRGKILIVERGDCTFVDKARRAQKAGAKAVIVCDNVPGSSGETTNVCNVWRWQQRRHHSSGVHVLCRVQNPRQRHCQESPTQSPHNADD